MADRIVIDERAARALSSSDEMRDLLMELAEPIVDRARSLAPKASGAGAASIRSEPVIDVDVWTVRISWTRDQYHMYFRQRGTVYQAAEDFLERALEGATE